MMLFWRPTAMSHGAASSADATTEPRPRLTNTIGSVQHTSVVTVDSRPASAGILEFMIPPRNSDTRAAEPSQLQQLNITLRPAARATLVRNMLKYQDGVDPRSGANARLDGFVSAVP